MSVKAMAWAWDQHAGGAGRKAVLIALADHAGEDFTCYPSTARLAEKTELTARTVRQYLDELEAAGLVIKAERRRRPDGTLGTWVYRLNQCRPVATGDGPPLATEHRTSDDRSPSPVTTGPRAEPSVEPSMNRVPPRDQLTRARLAELAGDEHARMASRNGARVHTPAGLARSKARELLRGVELDDLLDLDAARRRAGLDPIPQSVLVAAALGDRHSLAHYQLPEIENDVA